MPGMEARYTRSAIVHALRGWPTPLGISVTCTGPVVAGGRIADETLRTRLQSLGQQVVAFAMARSSAASA
jgi:FMN reductase